MIKKGKYFGEGFYTLLLIYLFSFQLTAQKNITIGGLYAYEQQKDNILTNRPSLERVRIIKNNYLFDVCYWQSENIGINTGLQIQNYRTAFTDTDSIYFFGAGHAYLRAYLIPINAAFKKDIIKIFKRNLSLQANLGLIFGINPLAINKLGQFSGVNTLTINGQVTREYEFFLNYNYAPIFMQLNIGAQIQYQIFKNFSIVGFFRYHQGLERIGYMNANYNPPGFPSRNVEVETKGTQVLYGFGAYFKIPLKKKQNMKNKKS